MNHGFSSELVLTGGREGGCGNGIHPDHPAYVVNTILQGRSVVRVLNHHASSTWKSRGNRGSVAFVSH